VIAALHGVTMSSRVPVESSAELWATTDSEGTILSVEARSFAGADAASWNDVAAGVLEALKGKRVTVPPGTKGMRMSFRVESRRRQATGHQTQSARTSILVTHDKPQTDRAASVRLGTPVYRCEVACTASGNFDPTDAALMATTSASRTVAVRSLGQERLR
jgi:hypothetical protein